MIRFRSVDEEQASSVQNDVPLQEGSSCMDVTSSRAELVLDACANVGEGPTWDDERGQLIWVDIPNGLVHRFDPSADRDVFVDAGQPVGAAVPAASGGLVLAARDGFALLDEVSGDFTMIAEVEADDRQMRMNDGKCDSRGRFWAGTMELDGRRPIGSLYRLDPNGSVVRVLTGISISNGMAWSPDDTTMYFIDSPTHGIDAFSFEPTTGMLSKRRRLAGIPPEWGLPDGMTIDDRGFLWVAFWSGGAVRSFTPDGRPSDVIGLPVSLVTSCAFGGEGLEDLFITSARDGLSAQELKAQPHAGSLFRARPGVAGLAQPRFGGP